MNQIIINIGIAKDKESSPRFLKSIIFIFE